VVEMLASVPEHATRLLGKTDKSTSSSSIFPAAAGPEKIAHNAADAILEM
jgi:hypothetical protein